MAIQIGVGSSSVDDSYKAGNIAAKEALKASGADKGDFALVFTVDKYKQEEVLQGITEVLGDIPLGGCCGTGVLTHEGLNPYSVAVMVGKSDELSVSFGIGEGISKDAVAAGEDLAKAISKAEPKIPTSFNSVLVTLPDGITGNCVSVIKGMFNILGSTVRYAGGGAGDNLKFVETFQFMNGTVYKDAVVGALVSSKKPIGLSIRHGWKPIGRPVVVTKSKLNVINEIDGRPAFDVYSEICGGTQAGLTLENFAEFSMTRPLGIPQLEKEYVIRDPLKVLEDKSIFCVAEVPENTIVRVMEGTRESIIEATKEAAREARQGLQGREPAAILVFFCVSLTLILKEEMTRQMQILRETIGTKVPMIGFYTFGEVGAMGGGPPQFHNKTVGIMAIGK